jgi:hypothetical protein
MTGRPRYVARFLSDAWFDEVTERGAPGDRPGLTVQQVVTGGPDGEVRYHVRVTDSQATVHPGEAAGPDITFTEDYATAVAVARGQLTVQAGLLDGRIRVGGNLASLSGRQELGTLDLVPAAVRAATTF